MKKLLLVAVAALSLGLANSSVAQNEIRIREQRDGDRWERRGDLSGDLQRLNYQFARVREELRANGARGWLWSRYSDLSHRRERIEWQLRNRRLDPERARYEIDRVRSGLREIQDRMRMRGDRDRAWQYRQ